MRVSALSTDLLFLVDDSGGLLTRRAIGAYLGLAIGDALGGTVEFLTPSEIRAAYRVHRDMVGGGWLRLRRGQVTDDTDMALALGRSILSAGRVDAEAAAAAFSDWMRRKPIDIGNTVRRGIAAYRRTGSPESPPCEYDAGNGACMRCLPVALATLGSSIAQVDAANRAQAHVTHNNPTSDAGTLCVLRMVQTALLGGDRAALAAIADELVAEDRMFDYSRKRSENPSGFIVDTLRTVFQSLFATDSFEAALVDCVNRGGDADTTGAITGMIAGALYGPAGIPPRWMRHLAQDVRHACIEQAQGLLKLSPLFAATGAQTQDLSVP
ncbi:MAG: ADP-ribosyl-[dinitrogen reductase] hydrolase [Thiohalocapsa sp.]|jgi:ADP-ribosyl-[dinitrogen reductase] hydrolase|uniref:ADP-ribosyl-[dinitrogen reductase] hydrolase n=1 Tax=Thiohalocapsa sp. TaxID=2497641 RepID=UPI0025D8DD2C|nr:ADP-ribosyl-[dinitrogen reductase] hydrolase [Thiohalocapsa sp.]MCG6939945.1 ADP-ribosyl-[dinitrogen reductase] hydrolase [Thiohalocapsa sp.]